MKSMCLAFCVLLCLGILGLPNAQAETTAQAGFDQLRSLVGQWKAHTSDGKTATVTYKLVSAGSVLLEEEDLSEGVSMITMYHLDGNNLILTHYCAAQNQPRMRADLAGSKPEELHFNFLDATNLVDPNAGHMRSVILKIRDKDHMTQEWTFRKDGKDGSPEVFEYDRVR